MAKVVEESHKDGLITMNVENQLLNPTDYSPKVENHLNCYHLLKNIKIHNFLVEGQKTKELRKPIRKSSNCRSCRIR